MVAYATCDVFGDIGTQLAQVSSVIGYCAKHNKTPVFRKNSEFQTFWCTLFDDSLNVLDDEEYLAIKFTQTITNVSYVQFENLPFIDGNVRLSGSFNMKNIPNCKEMMVDIVYKNEDLMYEAYDRLTKIKEMFESQDDDDYVSIYVDTNNQRLIDEGFYQISYDMSCRFGRKIRHPIIFTDNVERSKEILGISGAHYVNFNESIANFILLSFFDNNIIGESITSLYASFISSCKSKIVIASKMLIGKVCDENDCEEDEWNSYLDTISYI